MCKDLKAYKNLQTQIEHKRQRQRCSSNIGICLMCIETQDSAWYTVRSREDSWFLPSVSSQSKTHQNTSTHALNVLSQHVSRTHKVEHADVRLFQSLGDVWCTNIRDIRLHTSPIFDKNKVWDFARKKNKNLKGKNTSSLYLYVNLI